MPYWSPAMKLWFGVAGVRPAWTHVPSVPAKACIVDPSRADRRGVRARVRLGAARVDLSRLKRPGRAAVSGERGVRLALGIARVRGAEPAPERAQAARLDHERRVGEARPTRLDRGGRADPPGGRDHRVAEVLRVRPRRVVPRDMQHAVGGAREPDLVGARAVRGRHPLPRRRAGGSGAADGDQDCGDDATDLHGAILRSPEIGGRRA